MRVQNCSCSALRHKSLAERVSSDADAKGSRWGAIGLPIIGLAAPFGAIADAKARTVRVSAQLGVDGLHGGQYRGCILPTKKSIIINMISSE